MQTPGPGDSAVPTGPGWRAGTLTYSAAGLVALFCLLLLGDFAWAMKNRAVPDIFALLLRRYQVPDLWFGALTTALPAAITLVLAPWIGGLSDRHRGPLGRRIPFLIASTPVIVVGILGLTVAPAAGPWLAERWGGGADAARLATLACLGLCWAVFEAGTVISNGIFTALANDVVPRELIGRFFALFRVFSLITGILFNFYLFQHAEAWYGTMFAGVAVLYGVGFGVMCWRVREGSYPPLAPNVAATAEPLVRRWGTRARECLETPERALLFAVLAVATASAVPVETFALKAARSYGLDDAGFGTARAITYGISLVLAFPLGWLSDRFHPLRTTLAVLACYGLGMALGALLIHDGPSFQVFFIINGVLFGGFFTASASLLIRLLPSARFGQLAAVASVASMLVVIVVSLATGRLLDALGNPYRLTFALSAALALLTVVGGMVLYHRLRRAGGLDVQPTAPVP